MPDPDYPIEDLGPAGGYRWRDTKQTRRINPDEIFHFLK